MHILFVTGEYPPLRGGVGAYTQELARALATLGVQTSVLTAQESGTFDGTAASQEDASSVQVYPMVKRWGPSIWEQTSRLAGEIGADWLHVQYQTAAFAMNPAINFAPERWRSHFHVAWTYHDLLVPYLFPKAGETLRQWVTRHPARTSHAVVVTNEGDRRRLAGTVRELHTIPIGSNVRGVVLTAEERARLRQSWSYGEGQLVVGYFGFLNRSKGGLTLVQTIAELVRRGIDAHLLMVGERVGASDPTNHLYLAEVEDLIRRTGIEHRVRWTGHLADDEAGAALNAVDVLLLPYEDGASLRRGTLMAGLANGCAIVTTPPQAPIPELEDGRDLLYAPAGDPSACADAVVRVAREQGLARALRAAARGRSGLFSWDSIAGRHIALYGADAARAA